MCLYGCLLGVAGCGSLANSKSAFLLRAALNPETAVVVRASGCVFITRLATWSCRAWGPADAVAAQALLASRGGVAGEELSGRGIAGDKFWRRGRSLCARSRTICECVHVCKRSLYSSVDVPGRIATVSAWLLQQVWKSGWLRQQVWRSSWQAEGYLATGNLPRRGFQGTFFPMGVAARSGCLGGAAWKQLLRKSC